MPAAQIEPDQHRVSVAARTIRVLRKGNGPPLVVLHHSIGNRGWEDLHEQLSQSFDVVVPDLPGYGQSERPEWARSPRDIAILVGRLLDHMAVPNTHLVGLGLGGWIAAELGTLEPGRLDTLTLVGSPGLRPPHGEIVDQVPISFEAYVRLGFSSDEAFERVIGPQPSPEVVELWDYSREMTTRLTWKPWMFSLQLRHLLPEIRTPTLVVWGSEDRVVPSECGQLYAELLPNARLEVVEAGHLVDLEEPARLAKLITDHAHASVSSLT